MSPQLVSRGRRFTLRRVIQTGQPLPRPDLPPPIPLSFLDDPARNRNSFCQAIDNQQFGPSHALCFRVLLDQIWPADHEPHWKPGAFACCLMTNRDICEATTKLHHKGYGSTKVRDALRDLAAWGFIKCDPGSGRGAKDSYTICWDRPFAVANVDRPPRSRPRKIPNRPTGNSVQQPATVQQLQSAAEAMLGSPDAGDGKELVRAALLILKARANPQSASRQIELVRDCLALFLSDGQSVGQQSKSAESVAQQSKSVGQQSDEWMNECMKLKQSSIHTSVSSTSSSEEAVLPNRIESVAQHFSSGGQTEKVEGKLDPGQFRWPGGFPTDRQLRIPAQVQRRFELISGVEINGRVWWGTGPEERLAFFAEVNYALAAAKQTNGKCTAGSILAASIKDQNRRAIPAEPDPFTRKDKPSPEYQKACQQIRQLDGVPEPSPEPEQAGPSTPVVSEDLAERRKGCQRTAQLVLKQLRGGQPEAEPEPAVDLELDTETDRNQGSPFALVYTGPKGKRGDP